MKWPVQEAAEKQQKKVFSVFIELAQNVLRYSAEQTMMKNNRKTGAGIAAIREENAFYEVLAGNVLKKEDAEVIRKTTIPRSASSQGRN